MIGDAVWRLRGEHENRRIFGTEPLLDVIGRPRARRLILGDAIGVLARMPQSALVELSGPAAADIEQNQAQRAPDRRVGSVARAERVAVAVHPDLPRDRAL